MSDLKREFDDREQPCVRLRRTTSKDVLPTQNRRRNAWQTGTVMALVGAVLGVLLDRLAKYFGISTPPVFRAGLDAESWRANCYPPSS